MHWRVYHWKCFLLLYPPMSMHDWPHDLHVHFCSYAVHCCMILWRGGNDKWIVRVIMPTHWRHPLFVVTEKKLTSTGLYGAYLALWGRDKMPDISETFPYIFHYDDVIMSEIASQITSLTIVYSTVHSGADQSKHQSSASLAFVWEIHRWPVNFPHKWPVTRKIFPFDDVIMFVTKIYGLRLILYSSLFQLTIFRHWFR